VTLTSSGTTRGAWAVSLAPAPVTPAHRVLARTAGPRPRRPRRPRAVAPLRLLERRTTARGRRRDAWVGWTDHRPPALSTTGPVTVLHTVAPCCVHSAESSGNYSNCGTDRAARARTCTTKGLNKVPSFKSIKSNQIKYDFDNG